MEVTDENLYNVLRPPCLVSQYAQDQDAYIKVSAQQ